MQHESDSIDESSSWGTGFGVYVHIPFCRTKCNYCSFISRPLDQALSERYCRGVVREIESSLNPYGQRCGIESIYFGGGTPSLISSALIEEVLAALGRRFGIQHDCEISLEANPGTLTSEKVADYRRIGVNRISMGAQSFDDRQLVSVGRIHTADDVRSSLGLLRANAFSNLNLDLILGLPGQTEGGWNWNIEKICELRPTHISVYMLDLDPKVPLYHSIAQGHYSVPEDDAISEWYLVTLDSLEKAGYLQYEISNFALPGFACRHNLKYWERQPVLGFGIGSHSFDGRTRFANVSKMDQYLALVEEGKSAVGWREALDDHASLGETIFLGLRLNQGLDWNDIRGRYGSARVSEYEESLRRQSDAGLIAWGDSKIYLTRRGMLLSNEVFQEFV